METVKKLVNAPFLLASALRHADEMQAP